MSQLLSQGARGLVSVKEKEQKIAESELKLKEREQAASSWRNPLVVAILAPAIAAAGNAGISVYNGRSQRHLESQKADQARVLEMLRTNGDKELAAGNLQFLLDAGLIAQADVLAEFLKFRLNAKGIQETIYHVPTARPGYIEIWLGRVSRSE
jgi:N-acetylmuramoyl-L-alanine amidase